MVCNQEMYCPGICQSLAIGKLVAIMSCSYHGDNVAILMFRSHVLYLDYTKEQTSINLQQLRPLSSTLGRAAIRRLPRQNDPLARRSTAKLLAPRLKAFSFSPTNALLHHAHLPTLDSTPASIMQEAVEQAAS